METQIKLVAFGTLISTHTFQQLPDSWTGNEKYLKSQRKQWERHIMKNYYSYYDGIIFEIHPSNS